MEKLVDKAKVLIEALPYMQRFIGRTIIIKYGGHAMTDRELRRSFATDVVLLKHIGVKPVIVHGGGPQIARTLERFGKKSTFVGGLRVTDDETMEVVLGKAFTVEEDVQLHRVWKEKKLGREMTEEELQDLKKRLARTRWPGSTDSRGGCCAGRPTRNPCSSGRCATSGTRARRGSS